MQQAPLSMKTHTISSDFNCSRTILLLFISIDETVQQKGTPSAD